MNKDKINTRAFAIILGCSLVVPAGAQTYTVSVAEQQNCTVNISPQKDNYSADEVITVTITPADGAIFDGFSVYCQCSESEWWDAQSSRIIMRTRAGAFSYRLDIWNIDGHEDEPVVVNEGTQFTFTMPARNVEIEALYLSGSAQYDITRLSADNGTVSTDVNRAMAGETVTVTASPSAGYMVDEVKVYERVGGVYDTDMEFVRTGANTFTFTMPANPVRVRITFKTAPAVSDLSESAGITQYNVYDILDNTARFIRTFTAGKASTICLPFPMTSVAGGSVYTFTGIDYDDVKAEWVATMTDATPNGSSITATVANTPYLFMPDGNGEVTFTGTVGSVAEDIVAGSTTSTDTYWTFRGTYTRLDYGTAPMTGYVYGFAAKDKTVDGHDIVAGQFIRAKSGAYLPAFRAYLTYSGSDDTFRAPGRDVAAATQLPDRITVRLLSYDGTVTAVGTMDTVTGDVTIERWFDMNGRPVDGEPSEPGMYLNDKGKKVLIK